MFLKKEVADFWKEEMFWEELWVYFLRGKENKNKKDKYYDPIWLCDLKMGFFIFKNKKLFENFFNTVWSLLFKTNFEKQNEINNNNF